MLARSADADAEGSVGAAAPSSARARRRAQQARASTTAPRDAAVHAATIAGALGLWGVALPGARPGLISGVGLLGGLGWSWFAALGVLSAGFAIAAASARPRPVVLGAYVVALAVVLHATTAVLYPEPRYTWTYKHLGVIDYIGVHGSANRAIDVYQNWPGFFALNAWLSRVMGVSPLDYAGWAQLAFELADVSAVLFAVRGLTLDARTQWTTAWMFLVANWIGQDYLSPQAFTFLLSLVLLGVVIRCSPWGRPPSNPLGWALARARVRLAAAALRGRRTRPGARAPAPLGTRGAMAVGAALSVAVVISHQLSPALLIVSVAALSVGIKRPPIWVVVAMLILEVGWVGLSYDFVSSHFRIFDLSIPSASARSAPAVGDAPTGAHLASVAPKLAIVFFVLVAGAGLLRRLWAGHWDLVVVLLALAPVLVLGGQSYGGEAPLRVLLFALPWLSFLVAAAVAPDARAHTTLRRAWRTLAVTAVVGVGTLFGLFGQETLNYVTGDDVAVSRWYDEHADPRSTFTFLAPSFPERVSAAYPSHLYEPGSLFEVPGFAGLAPQARLVLDRIRFAQHRYLILSPSQERYVAYYGLAPPGRIAAMVAELEAAPGVRVAYRHGDAVVLEFLPTSSPGRRPGGA